MGNGDRSHYCIEADAIYTALHPSGGAGNRIGVMSGARWDFLLTPVLTESIVIVLCTALPSIT